MYEFHGWITLRETSGTSEDTKLEETVAHLQNYIKNLHWEQGLLDVRWVNGQLHLALSGFVNHKGEKEQEILSLYTYVSNITPGSYGLLYILDDEDSKGYDNTFQVYVLARGKINKNTDSFLSPFVPTVEDHD